MGLTLRKEQRLEKAKLTEFFDKNREKYEGVAQQTFDFLKSQYGGNPVRPDDVANSLEPVITIDEELQGALDKKKLTQNYWFGYFCDLIIERTWDTISVKKGDKDAETED